MSNENLLVSVIIPTYNRPDCLKRAVGTVLNQTYENIEVIVVDESLSAPAQRNIGIKRASGKFIAFLDDDDYFTDKRKIEEQMKILKKDKKVGFIGCGYHDARIDSDRMPLFKGNISNNLLVSFGNIETSTIIFRKELVDKVGDMDTTFKSSQNHDLFYRLSKVSKFDFVDKVMVYKGAGDGSNISTNRLNKMQGYIHFHRKYIPDIIKLPKKMIIFVIVKFIITSALFLLSPKVVTKLYTKIMKGNND